MKKTADLKTGTTEFPKVWIADAKRASSVWKFLVYDDTGRLTITSHGIHFQSENRSEMIAWPDVIGLANRRQVWAYAIHAGFVAVTCLFVFAGALTDDVGFIWALLEGCAPAAAFAIFGSSVGELSSVPWAVVSYRTSDGETAEMWIADAGGLGWRGKTGGTKIISDAIETGLDGSPTGKKLA